MQGSRDSPALKAGYPGRGMDYHKASHDELVARIEELERLNSQLLEEQRQEIGLDFAWTGNLGHWYWDYRTNTVTFNPLKAAALGYDMSELPERVPYQFFTDRLHPGDFDITMDAMRDHLYGRKAVYEAEYRIKAKDGSWRWFYDRGSITQRDEAGKPIFMAGIVFDITQKKEMELELAAKNLILAEQSTTDGLTGLSWNTCALRWTCPSKRRRRLPSPSSTSTTSRN